MTSFRINSLEKTAKMIHLRPEHLILVYAWLVTAKPEWCTSIIFIDTAVLVADDRMIQQIMDLGVIHDAYGRAICSYLTGSD